MNKLIVLPGRADSPFFLNELKILTQKFDEVVIISYPISKREEQKIRQAYKVDYYTVGKKQISLNTIQEFRKWIRNHWTKQEIINNAAFSKKGILRLMYILMYGVFSVQTYEILLKEVEKSASQVYLYSYWLSRPAYAVAYFLSQNKKKVKKAFSRAHRYDLYDWRNDVGYLPFRKFIYDQLDSIYFISKDGMDYYKDWLNNFGGNDGKTNLLLSYLGTYNQNHWKKEIKEKSEIVVASCSAIISVKRLDLIIRTLEYVKDMKLRWIHIGTGELEEKIKKMAVQKLPHLEVKFLGEVDNERILQIYKKEDVDYFINLSDSEGLPVSIMEALSLGIPVIGRDVGGVREIVNDRTGCLLRGGIDRRKIYSFLKLRVEQPEQYEAISKEAIYFWEQNFDGNKNYRDFIEDVLRR